MPNEADPDQDYIADADVAFIDDMILSAAAAFFYDRPDVFWLRSFGYTIYVDLSKDAAGNITGSTDRIVISYTRGSYPGAYEDVIAVGSVDKNMNVSSFSNKNDSVFVVAPGEDVYSLGTLPFTVYKSSGTSFSAPFVSGLAAMLKEKYPQMGQKDFGEILKASSKDLGEPGYDTSYGYGLIQVPQAIDAAETYFGDAGSDPEPSPVAPDSGSSEDDQSTNSGSLVSDRVKNLVQKTLFYSILKKLGIR